MFAVNGILFNHESPFRGETFVTRKITRALCRIKLGLQSKLYLGNLDALRDWGHAEEYVEMQWLMLQANQPSDFVIATGRQASVRDFIDLTADALSIHLCWKGKGESERGYWGDNEVIVVDPDFYRPAEVETLLGDPSQARASLGWSPKRDLVQLVNEMVKADLELANREMSCGKFGLNRFGSALAV
jgi:GDPmannose 4,6-dehydratase